MPKRTDIQSILLIGSGPIVIGQACEFDYAGTQACKALREEGYKVILINSNPATIMTDLDIADCTYIEPITAEFITRIIIQERPQAILSTMGGQTALNLVLELEKNKILTQYGVELLGASLSTIQLAENRTLFRQTVQKLGLDLPKSFSVKNLEEAMQVIDILELPIMVRSSFSLGGTGSGIVFTQEELTALCEQAFAIGPDQELLLDEALIGWKEFEMEVVRDRDDNCIIVCCMENIDPLGIHTGDSITVAPPQTLSDKEYQKMRNASFSIVRAVGIETGGANVQFAINPKNGRMVVIEMNPRVSRSSALASKVTGFPIAKIATKLAVGYTLPELFNDLTGNKIPASFEPALDYVAVKIPRFNFEKFQGCEVKLDSQMHSVGEIMAIGRTFKEALLKGMRSIDIASISKFTNEQHIKQALKTPSPHTLWTIFDAFRVGISLQEIHDNTAIDPWFLSQIEELILWEKKLSEAKIHLLSREELYHYKQLGFSDLFLGKLLGCDEETVRNRRYELTISPTYKRIDSCAGEFASSISYLYATYEEECESFSSDRSKIIILGSGPSRIGQGVEFDYSCVHAIHAFKEMGFETIIINCNPETISTDYDCADKLYFAPLVAEDVLDIIKLEQPQGVLVQYGGQTALHLASALIDAEVPILGITPSLIEQTEDRAEFQQFLKMLDLKQPDNFTLQSMKNENFAADELEYPLIIRPSFVLGGMAMSLVFHPKELEECLQKAFETSNENPVLVEQFLTDAIEVDIDAICDGETVFIPGILEHVEPAGVHSGDSACSIPPFRLSTDMQKLLAIQTKKIALALKVIGLINIQFAIQNEEIYVLEVNLRASRTCPFVSKATGIDLVKVATRCLMGFSLKSQGYYNPPKLSFFAVKEAILPFIKFKNIDSLLGPEMKSTGEVMGWGRSFAEAYAKTQIASGYCLPKKNSIVVLSLCQISDKEIQELTSNLANLELPLYAVPSTASLLEAYGIRCKPISFEEAEIKAEGKEIGFIITIEWGKKPDLDGYHLRQLALKFGICYATTASAAISIIHAMQIKDDYSIKSLNSLLQQDIFY